MWRTRPALWIGVLAAAVVVLWWMATSRPQGDGERTSDLERVPAPPAGSDDESPAVREPSHPSAAPAAPAPLAPGAASAEQDRTATQEAPQAEPAPPAGANLPQQQGPVDELSRRFASESRGDGSQQAEANARKAFTDPTIPTDMLRAIECRRSICRAELRWSEQSNDGYVLGLTQAVGSFSAALGIAAPGDPEADGRRTVVVYWSLAN